MKVLDIISKSSAYLGLFKDYKTYFEPKTSNNETNILPEQISTLETSIPEEKQEELELLLLSFNNIQEKILRVLPLKTKENIIVAGNKIEFSMLSNKVNKILSVRNKSKKLNFKVFNNYLLVNLLEGENSLEIEYSFFLPNVESLEDFVELDNIVRENTLSLGVTSEYCFIEGLFDDADIWNKKFLDELKIDRECLKSFVMPRRSWR